MRRSFDWRPAAPDRPSRRHVVAVLAQVVGVTVVALVAITATITIGFVVLNR